MTPPADKVPVTAIILTLNEADNIARCIDCLTRADEIVVVDSGSTDATLSHARQARGDVRILTHPFKDFGDQRNWALEHGGARNDWILFVDADEFCDDALLDEIAAFVMAPSDKVGAFIAGRNYFLGRWLRHSTLFPSYQLRLLKLGAVTYVRHGHGQREVTSGPLHYLMQGWRHEGLSKGVADWIGRHNRYSSNDVELLVDMRLRPMAWRDLLSANVRLRRMALLQLSTRIPLRPYWMFLYRYVIRRGFMDGRAGLVYCQLIMAHYLHMEAKLAERAHAEWVARQGQSRNRAARTDNEGHSPAHGN